MKNETELLQECKLQLEYLNEKFGETGTTNALLTKLDAVLRQPLVSGSLPDDKRILTEAILVARKVDSDVGLLPSNQDIKMFCLGAKWMRDWAEGNDR